MNSGRTIFAQLMDLLPLAEFRRCVERYDGDYKVQSFSCLDQFLCLAYAQLTYRESLRDIETCLRAHARQLYHMGFRGGISRNNLANANRQRDWRIYADFARVLIAQARGLYQDEPFGLELDQTVYAFDSTTIDLCLALFPWAQFRRHKSAVKLHTLLDLRGSIPTAVYVTGGQVNDVKLLDQLVWEAGAFYLLDRGYIDYRRLYLITQALAFFVTRADQNMCYRACQWRGVDHAQGLRSDQTIRLTGPQSSQRYPAPLRRIHYFDAEKDLRLVFLTNNFHLAAPAHRSTLPRALASRVVLSLDQTASAYPGFLRHLRERREDASVGGDQCLRPGGHPQKTTPPRPELAQNSANSERHEFRKKPDFTGFFAIQRANSKNDPSIQLDLFNL